jgi:hypothetical protein
MTSLISLGAINKLTGEYVYPKIANKKDEYSCPECNKDLILCQGDIRVHHFRHKVATNPCHHYSSPTETQIHKDAKLLMKTLLDKKIPVSFVRNCCCCKKNDEYEIPETSETSEIRLEHRFEYHGPKVADVAYIENGEILCIFEICNTHKTRGENRPEPWFEIDAETLIRIANDNCLSRIQIPCIRCEKCEDCVEKENSNLKLYNIEKYVRIKLGQTIFPTPTQPKICNYSHWYFDVWKNTGHLRFDFDAKGDYEQNKRIIDIFNNDFRRYNGNLKNDFGINVIIHSYKGAIVAYIVSNTYYNKYNYWNIQFCDIENMYLPCIVKINITGESTIGIIVKLIGYCEKINVIVGRLYDSHKIARFKKFEKGQIDKSVCDKCDGICYHRSINNHCWYCSIHEGVAKWISLMYVYSMNKVY